MSAQEDYDEILRLVTAEDSGKESLPLAPGDVKKEGEDIKTEDAARQRTGKERRRERRLKNEPRHVVGSGEGPSGVNVLDFAEARATELKAMLKAVQSKRDGAGKKAFQRLPVHMRRRAMSHNPKRLPKRLRHDHMTGDNGAEETKKKSKKSLSRRQKRQTKSLREEYFRRRENKVWLETHIWHAKRMKMVDKYGYRLAEHCNDKGVRAAYKSLVYGCLISDLSYYCCYEVCGEQSNILTCLGPLFSTETGLTIRAKAYLGGLREGKAVMYRANSYPYGAIGPVLFLWQAPPPVTMVTTREQQSSSSSVNEGEEMEIESPDVAQGRGGRSKDRKLWLWCHPAIRQQVLSELESSIVQWSYAAELQQQESALSSKTSQEEPSSLQRVSVVTRNLARFRLIGPRSHALLMETLKPVWRKEGEGQQLLLAEEMPAEESDSGCSKNMSECEEEAAAGGAVEDDNMVGDSKESDGGGGGLSLPPVEKWWLGEDLKPQLTRHVEVLSEQYPSILSASEPAQFACGAVLSVCVQDPRLFTPSQRTDMVSAFYPRKTNLFSTEEASDARKVPDLVLDSATPQQDGVSSILPTSLSPEVAFSPLWDIAVCESISKSKIPDRFLNAKRSQSFLKPPVLNLGTSAPQIPVMLIQHTSNTARRSLGSGWDLVFPLGWAMAFWVALIYRGARACGLNELRKCSLESGALHFPQDFPDTDTGMQDSLERRRQLEASYLRKPPDKRQNYGKMLVAAPFHCPWEELARYWLKRRNTTCSTPIMTCSAHVMTCADPLTCSAPVSGVKRELEAKDDGGICKKLKLSQEESDDVDIADEFCSVELQERTLSDVGLVRQRCGYYVLRAREELKSLKLLTGSLLSNRKKNRKSLPQEGIKCLKEDIWQSITQECSIDSLLEKHSNALVAVHVEIHGRGTLCQLDSLSLLSASDIRTLMTKDGRFTGPVEQLNQRGVTAIFRDSVVVGISSLTRKEMKDLKKTKKGKSDFVDLMKLFPVRPSRQTVGYVTSAGQCLTTSCGSGRGFVTVCGLVEALHCCHCSGLDHLLLLARGGRTQYYLVKINLL